VEQEIPVPGSSLVRLTFSGKEADAQDEDRSSVSGTSEAVPQSQEDEANSPESVYARPQNIEKRDGPRSFKKEIAATIESRRAEKTASK
jgi:hypothetical protein